MSSSCLLVQLTLLVAVIIPGSRTFDCVTPTKDPNAPHMPEIMGDSYQAHLELNILDKNKTWAIEEYLDYNGNRGARLVSEGNRNTKYIYSFDTDEIFTINDDDTCTVVNMSSPEARSLTFGFGSQSVSDDGDRRHVFGAAATFKLARGTTDFYAGKDTVRGIAANKWTRCVPGPIKMQVSYYFSAPDWTMPLNIQMPLRIEVEGILPGSSPRYIHHNYDFIGYRPDIVAKSTMFETPKDVICTGRQNTKALPTFTNQFQYSAENVDPVKQGIMHFNVWYDGVSRLVRIDKRDVEPLPPLYTTNPVTEIHDHNTGVRYIKDRLLGNCSIHPLSSNSVDSLQDPQKTIELSDPNRFFSFTKNYTYTGQRTVRGIPCDVYAAVIPNYSYEGITGNAVFSYYFLSSPPWQDQPLQGSTFDNKRYPVHLEIIVPSTDFIKIVNFFDFDDLETDMSKFDVSDCFDEKNKLDFRVIFPGKYDPSTENEFKYYATYALANAIALSPIRIGNLAITSDLNNVFLSGSLLGTSAQAQFQLVDKKSPERVLEKTFFSVKLPDQCADMCVKNKPDLCQGYQYCPDDGFSCGLSMYHVLNQTIKTDGGSCAFFTRTISNYPYPKEPTISQAYDALAKSI